MDEHKRHLEQRALENVRALVEKLERDESNRRAWQLPMSLGLVVVVALAAAWTASKTGSASPSPDEARRLSCQLDVWASRSGDIERSLRKAHSEMPYRDIQKLLERERPFVMAAAKIECDERLK
jgi:hypothetical protein